MCDFPDLHSIIVTNDLAKVIAQFSSVFFQYVIKYGEHSTKIHNFFRSYSYCLWIEMNKKTMIRYVKEITACYTLFLSKYNVKE